MAAPAQKKGRKEWLEIGIQIFFFLSNSQQESLNCLLLKVFTKNQKCHFQANLLKTASTCNSFIQVSKGRRIFKQVRKVLSQNFQLLIVLSGRLRNIWVNVKVIQTMQIKVLYRFHGQMSGILFAHRIKIERMTTEISLVNASNLRPEGPGFESCWGQNLFCLFSVPSLKSRSRWQKT